MSILARYGDLQYQRDMLFLGDEIRILLENYNDGMTCRNEHHICSCSQDDHKLGEHKVNMMV